MSFGGITIIVVEGIVGEGIEDADEVSFLLK